MGLECVENKFLKLPNIQKYEIVSRTEDGFIASVEMDDGYEFQIYASFLNRVFPSTVIKLIEKQNKSQKVNILVAPYISERTAQICEDTTEVLSNIDTDLCSLGLGFLFPFSDK